MLESNLPPQPAGRNAICRSLADIIRQALRRGPNDPLPEDRPALRLVLRSQIEVRPDGPHAIGGSR